MQERFPELFIIGAPKCGTTTVFEWLKLHPGTHLTAKEPNFFSRDVFDADSALGINRSLEDYLDLICPEEAAGLLTGEATPKYLYSDMALTALSEHRKSIKIIVMLRNPIDLAVALHAQFLSQGYETQPDFNQSWAKSDNSKDLRFNYQFWGMLGTRLEKVFQVFDRDQVMVMLLEEDLSKDPERAYQQILDFLGLESIPLQSAKVYNERRGIKLRMVNTFSRKMRRIANRAARAMKIRLPNTGMLRTLDRFNRVSGARKEISSDLRNEMRDFFMADVALIAKVLERDSLPWRDFYEHK